MEFGTAGAPVFSCRRLLRPDLPRLCGLYRDSLAPLAVPGCALVEHWFDLGECFGLFCGGELAGAVTLLPFTAHLSPALELRFTGCVRPGQPEHALLICGVATRPSLPALPLTEALLRFVSAVLERSGKASELFAAAPVKTTTGVAAFFNCGFQLRAIRPLNNLTPCYLMAPARDDLTEGSMLLPLADTLSVARALENGWRGAAVRRDNLLLLR